MGAPKTYVCGNLDISDMDYFVFDLYVSDIDLFNSKVSGAIELTSSANWDVAEISYALSNLKNVISTGWNRIAIPISSFSHFSSNDTVFEPKKVNFFRIYTECSKLGIAVGNLAFGKN